MGQIKVECDPRTSFAFSETYLPSQKNPVTDINLLARISSDYLVQMHLVLEAQALIRKSVLYESINQSLNALIMFQPTVFSILSYQAAACEDREQLFTRDLPILSCHRDLAISNLRFLSIFYDTGPMSFAFASNFLDRLLSRVAVSQKFLPIVSTSCFYLATCFTSASANPIDLDDLLKLTQCDASQCIFLEVTNRIRNEFDLDRQQPVTSVSFLELFYNVLALHDERLHNADFKTFVIARLGLLLCKFEFMKFRYDLLALAMLQYFVQGVGLFSEAKQQTLMELRFYCRMDEEAYRECLSLIEQYMIMYETRPTRQPRLKLTWTVSRRVLVKRRPSLLVQSNLEPLMEEESLNDWSPAVLNSANLSDQEPCEGLSFQDKDLECTELEIEKISLQSLMYKTQDIITRHNDLDVPDGEDVTPMLETEEKWQCFDDSVKAANENDLKLVVTMSDANTRSTFGKKSAFLVRNGSDNIEECGERLSQMNERKQVDNLITGGKFEARHQEMGGDIHDTGYETPGDFKSHYQGIDGENGNGFGFVSITSVESMDSVETGFPKLDNVSSMCEAAVSGSGIIALPDDNNNHIM